MFSRKARHNYRTGIFTAVILCLCALIVALAWPSQPSESTDAQAAVNPDIQTYQPSELPELPELQDENEDEAEEESEEENSMNTSSLTYYLVKRAGADVVVFFCDSNGNMVQLETTEILYEMLGPEDQKLFDQGIRADSQEELSILLQDFES